MCEVFFNQFVFFNSPILYSVPVRTNRCLLTSWQKSKQDTELHAVSCFSPWVWVWWTPSEDLFQRPIDVFSVTRPSPRRANGFSSAQCWMWPDSRTRQLRWENTIHTSSFTSSRTDDADQQTGKNVNAACVRAYVRVCVCTCEVSMHPLSIASIMYYAHILLLLKVSYVSYAFTLKGVYVHLCWK